MITLTAIIRCKPGSEAHIRDALLLTAAYAEDHEAGTVTYSVTAGDNAATFVTHERYRDRAALDDHNNGPGATRFFAEAEGHLEEVIVEVGEEIYPPA